LAYLDEIKIFSPNEASHLNHGKIVLERIVAAGVKAKPPKCTFLSSKMAYLGYEVSAGTVYSHPGRLSGMQSYPTPRERFLGMASFYRCHIPNFAHNAAPLEKITSKQPVSSHSNGPSTATAPWHCSLSNERLSPINTFFPGKRRQ
jgi:hypothetical protein